MASASNPSPVETVVVNLHIMGPRGVVTIGGSGPDVIPPVDTGLGGSNARHPRRIIRYEKPDKPKPRTFLDRIGEPFLPLETTPEPVPSAADAAPPRVAPVQEALSARLPEVSTHVPTPTVRAVPPVEDDDDEDLLLLS